MENKICCGFGHREIFEDIDLQLAQAIERLIEHEDVRVFLTGGMGEFDARFSSAVQVAKRKHANIKLILVKPYFTKDLNTDKLYYERAFDSVIIPEELAGAHYKAIIKRRNQWMVDHSNYVLCFLYRDFGGAFDAVQYAKRRNKSIIRLAR